MQSVALINYGSGNLRSAEKALVKAADGRARILVTDDPAEVARALREAVEPDPKTHGHAPSTKGVL